MLREQLVSPMPPPLGLTIEAGVESPKPLMQPEHAFARPCAIEPDRGRRQQRGFAARNALAAYGRAPGSRSI